jgi:limonene-1,2-epoxide hydrolase
MKIVTELDYARRIAFRAPRERVYDALATPEGIRGWWTTIVTGSGAAGGGLRLGFAGLGEGIVMRVDELAELGPDECELSFRHLGLAPELDCYDVCERGWDRFLGSSLVAYVERGSGMRFGAAGGALDVVRRYHDAWTSKDFDQAARYLAADLETDVPLNTYEGSEQFLAALTGLGQLVTSVDLLAEFENGAEVILLYDLAAEPIGSIRIAEHFTVDDGRISRIRHVHDTAALRAAGFANDERTGHGNDR